jgi:hypothetical protein
MTNLTYDEYMALSPEDKMIERLQSLADHLEATGGTIVHPEDDEYDEEE